MIGNSDKYVSRAINELIEMLVFFVLRRYFEIEDKEQGDDFDIGM